MLKAIVNNETKIINIYNNDFSFFTYGTIMIGKVNIIATQAPLVPLNIAATIAMIKSNENLFLLLDSIEKAKIAGIIIDKKPAKDIGLAAKALALVFSNNKNWVIAKTFVIVKDDINNIKSLFIFLISFINIITNIKGNNL